MLGKTVLLSFLLLCPFTCPLLLKSCNFDVKITQSLLNEGFHRNITYTIQFNNEDENEQLYMDCIVGIDQTLPPGVYVNPDELGELKRHNKITAIPKNRVNVELPTEQSPASNVFLVGSVRAGAARLWLPAHARYHRARRGGGMARNEIGPPQLYLRCPGRRLQACPPPAAPAPAPARAFLCGGAAGDQCSWQLVPYTMLTAPLVWSVPLGDTGRLTLVAAGSLAALLAGSLHILAALHQYKRRGKRA